MVRIEAGSGESGTTSAPAEDSPFSFDGEAITLSAAPAQEISGQTDLAAGTEVAVRVQSADSESPFLARPTATVGEDGRFSVQLNLSTLEPDTDAVATLRADGETVAERAVRIESAGGNATGDESVDGPTLDDSILQTRVDQSTTATLQFGGADTATIAVRSDGVDGEPTWEVVATVEDTDGDGSAAIQFDADAVDEDAPVLSAADDEVTIDTSSSLDDSALDPAEYEITVDSGSEIDDEPTGIATLVLLASDDRTESADGNGSADESADGDATTDTSAESDDGATDSGECSQNTSEATGGTDDGGLSDTGLVGGSVVGLLTLFGVGTRLLN